MACISCQRMKKPTAHGMENSQITYSRPTYILFFRNTFSSYHNVYLDVTKLNNGFIVMVYIKLIYYTFFNVDVQKVGISGLFEACMSGGLGMLNMFTLINGQLP